jgi:hypothetical protein
MENIYHYAIVSKALATKEKDLLMILIFRSSDICKVPTIIKPAHLPLRKEIQTR